MFERGKLYKRNRIHEAYNGARQLQQQGGILTPAGQPFLVIITGESGARHGYHDHLDADGVLHYYGAGQNGDMEWSPANRQLRDHASLGKDVHLFREVSNGGTKWLRYDGQYSTAGHYFHENAPGTDGASRRAIVFQLVPHDELLDDPPDDARAVGAIDGRWTMDFAALRDLANVSLGQQPASSTGRRRLWERSYDVKVYVRRRANGICEGCEQPAPFNDRKGRPYLEPHHTRRLTDGGPDDVHHVIGLCPACHRRVHHGQDGETYNNALSIKLKELEPPR